MAQYVALLRGINVGGNNIIRMSELKACFEGLGFSDVATFIQSGNVLFAARKESAAKLAARIEAALSDRFGYESRIVLRDHAQMRAIVSNAPKGFGSQADLYRYDVVFLREPFTAAEVVKDVPTRDGVDQVFAGNGACYFSRLTSRASQSHMSRIIALPSYKSMTIRNWNTTVKLLAIMDVRTAAAAR